VTLLQPLARVVRPDGSLVGAVALAGSPRSSTSSTRTAPLAAFAVTVTTVNTTTTTTNTRTAPVAAAAAASATAAAAAAAAAPAPLEPPPVVHDDSIGFEDADGVSVGVCAALLAEVGAAWPKRPPW